MNDLELLELAEGAHSAPTVSKNPEQQGAGWLLSRVGNLGASSFWKAIDTLKNGKPSKTQTDYLKQLVAERMTGVAASNYVTPAMQWGIDNEPGARMEYERITGNQTELVGFILHPTIQFCGASPDGLVGEDGLIEIKCPNTATYLEWLTDGGIPEDHKPQMLLQLACTRRKWCDFVAFDPRIKRGPQIFIRRFEPTPADIEGAEAQAAAFLAQVDELFERVTLAN